MLAWLTALMLAASSAHPAPRCIQIVGTNDVHGHIEPDVTVSGSDQVSQGGLATFGGYLSILRRHYPKQILLLDAGDLFQGTVPSNLSKGAAVIAAYNQMGYQAAALGNHEFDFGPERGESDPLGAIKQRVGDAHFPFLSANLYESSSGQHPHWKNLRPSMLTTINGIKVGIIGAITPDTPSVTVPVNVATLQFRDTAPEVEREAAALRKEGAKLIVVVAHLGGECKDLSNPDDLGSCVPHSELFDMVNQLPAGAVDVVIAGHTHKYIAKNVDHVAVSEAGSYSHSFSWVEACVGGDEKVTTRIHPPQDICLREWKGAGCGPKPEKPVNAPEGERTEPSRFLGEPVKPDPGVQRIIAPYLDRVRSQQESMVGVTVASPMLRSHDRASPLGRLVAASMRRAVPGAQVAMTNAGGIRADLPAGPLKFRHVFEVLPFDNRLVGLKLTGAQLRDFVLAPLEAGHGYPQIDGAHLEIDPKNPQSARLVLDGGSPIDPKAEYLVATNDFLANGGDGERPVLDGLPAERKLTYSTLLRDAFLDFLKRQPQPVKPPP